MALQLLEIDLGRLGGTGFGLEVFLALEVQNQAVGEAVGKAANGAVETLDRLHCIAGGPR